MDWGASYSGEKICVRAVNLALFTHTVDFPLLKVSLHLFYKAVKLPR